jgi:hypothetical protein
LLPRPLASRPLPHPLAISLLPPVLLAMSRLPPLLLAISLLPPLRLASGNQPAAAASAAAGVQHPGLVMRAGDS